MCVSTIASYHNILKEGKEKIEELSMYCQIEERVSAFFEGCMVNCVNRSISLKAEYLTRDRRSLR
jgi:hypothetical protein